MVQTFPYGVYDSHSLNKRPKNLSVIRIHAVRYPSNFPFRKVLDCSYVKGPLKRIGTVLNRASFLKDGSFKL